MKRICIFTVLALTGLCAYAQQISEQEAMERALQYLGSGKTSVSAPGRDGNIKLESAPVDAASVYAFNMEGGGFIIASADSRTLPVLGYSTTGTIDWNQLPDNMRSWLKSYDDAVASLGNTTDFVDGNAPGDVLQTRSDSRKKLEPVEPLIKTRWNQDAPYWNLAPLYQGADPDLKWEQCYAGCVATAMAQIMNYYQWPKAVPEGLPDYEIVSQYDSITKVWHIDALPPVVFDWDNMIDDYVLYNSQTGSYDSLGTEEQHNAVATLMRYCGQSLKMIYGPAEKGGSLAYPDSLPGAFKTIFDYKATTLLSRTDFSDICEWDSLIYSELAARRPVLYSGSTGSSGHAFVCDGYDGNGFFHINWGWGGAADGYFSLSVLNPYDIPQWNKPIHQIGFSLSQNALIYTDPAMDLLPYPAYSKSLLPELYQQFVMRTDNINNITISCLYKGEDVGNAVVEYALGIVGEDGAWKPLFMGDSQDTINADNKFNLVVDSTIFQPGDSLTLYPMVRFCKDDAQWQVLRPLESHLVAGRTENGSFFVSVHGKNMIECLDSYISKGTGRLDELCNVTIIVRNNSNWDYTGFCAIFPYYYGYIKPEKINEETPCAEGQFIYFSPYLKAGQETELKFPFYPASGGYTKFISKDSHNSNIFSFSLELTNDTLADYDDYVENRSYLSRQGDKYYYNVELCDVPGMTMARWIPSDSIGLKVRFTIDDNVIDSVFIRDEIREYLDSLPNKIGGGNYTFSLQVPIEFERDGEYAITSCIGEWIDNNITTVSCTHSVYYDFRNPTIVMPSVINKAEEPCYDLLGRPVEGLPDRKGLYIKGKKKFVVIK